MTLADTIQDIIKGAHRALRIVTDDEVEATASVVEAAMALQWPVSAWTATTGIYDGALGNMPPIPKTENAGGALAMLREVVLGRGEHAGHGPRLIMLLDMAQHLVDEKIILRAWRELYHAACMNNPNAAGTTIVMIDHHDNLPPIVKTLSVPIEVPLPGPEQIESIVRTTLRGVARELQNTGGTLKADISKSQARPLLANLTGLTSSQVRRVVREVTLKDKEFSVADLPAIMSAKRRFLESGGVLEPVESPTTLQAIGGMKHLKRWLAQREITFGEEAKSLGLLPPRGVLLLGVQGAGKSLCAKAIATAWGRPLMRLDAGALYDRYVGESEKRLRTALHQAEMMAPVVLWIDEIEKAFAGAASTSTDGGLSRRMFGTLLTWMQEHRSPVFLAATANDIEALPPELLRKGRFDEIFFVDLPSREARRAILTIHLRARKQAPETFDLDTLTNISNGYSGAEIEQAIVSSLSVSLSQRKILDTACLQEVFTASPPLSVTMREKMEHLREWAKGRCVPADDACTL